MKKVEPRLLGEPLFDAQIFQFLDRITADLKSAKDRREEDYRTLPQALGYAWSVVVATDSLLGKPYIEEWYECSELDIRWIMRENLKKVYTGWTWPG